MENIESTNSTEVIKEFLDRVGGSLDFEGGINLSQYSNWIRSSTIPKDFIPFEISIYDTDKNEDVLSLIMMINPRDLNIGQAQVVNAAYSRVGWINTLWGNQQATITASGLSAGFYYITNTFEGGITNFNRKNSIAFLNLISIVSFFKNNAYYFMDGQEIPSLFKDNHSRAINVMDTIKITYDGSEYLGSFNSFSLNDVATNPYRLDYSFEFTVSSFGTDTNSIEGHVKKNKNDQSNTVVTAIQGYNTRFLTSVQMSLEELNKTFPPDQEYKHNKEYYLNILNPLNRNFKSGAGLNLKTDNIPIAWGSIIAEAVKQPISKDYPVAVDPNLVAAVIRQESTGNQYAVSFSGAKGLMQLMDGTARQLGVTSSFDPRDNIFGGTRYLSQLLKKYNNNEKLALAAYNAGPSRVDKAHGIPKIAETIDYVNRVTYYHDHYLLSSSKRS